MLRSQSWPSLELELDSMGAVDTVLVTEPPSYHLRRGARGASVISVSQRNGIFYSLDETEPARSDDSKLPRGLTLPPLTTIQETEARPLYTTTIYLPTF